MKLKVGELLIARPPLQALAATKMPARDAYRVSRLMAKITPEINTAETPRMECVRRYGKVVSKDPMGNEQWSVDMSDAEAFKKFAAEVQPLLESEIDVDVVPLPLTILEHADISAEQILALGPFLEEEK